MSASAVAAPSTALSGTDRARLAELEAVVPWGQSVAGVTKLVEQFSRPGDTILDPFVGGGPTAVAALELGRRFIGIDVDEQAIRTTATRIAELMEAAA